MEEQYVYMVNYHPEFITAYRYILVNRTDNSVVVQEGAIQKTYRITTMDHSFFFDKEEAKKFAVEKANKILSRLEERASVLKEFIDKPTFTVVKKYEIEKIILTDDNFN